MAGIFWTLVGLVVLTPLPLASVYMWSWALMGCTVGLLLAAWGTIAVVSRQPPAVGLGMIWPVAGLFTLAAVWAALQGSLVTPAEWHHPLWKSAGEVLELKVASRITVDPFRTYSALLRLLTYAGIFWLSLKGFADKPFRARLDLYNRLVRNLRRPAAQRFPRRISFDGGRPDHAFRCRGRHGFAGVPVFPKSRRRFFDGRNRFHCV